MPLGFHRAIAFFDDSHKRMVLSIHDDLKKEHNQRYIETQGGVAELCQRGEEMEAKTRLQFTFTDPDDCPIPIALAVVNACHVPIALKIKASSNEIFRVSTPTMIVPRMQKKESGFMSQINIDKKANIPFNGDHFFRIYVQRMDHSDEKDPKAFWKGFNGTPDYIWTVKIDFKKAYPELGLKKDNHCANCRPGCSYWTPKDYD